MVSKSERVTFCDLEVVGRLIPQVPTLAMIANDGDEFYVVRSANSLAGSDSTTSLETMASPSLGALPMLALPTSGNLCTE
jgi:hypothetical protein